MANNTKIIRQSKGLTQEQLAKKVKNVSNKRGFPVSSRYIRMLESKTELPVSVIERLAKALKVKAELFTRDGLKLIQNLE